MTNMTIATQAVRVGYAALASLALFSSAPAAADSPRQERVAYGDLDLTSDAGQSTLDNRIRAAVKRVCKPDGGSLTEFMAWNRCKRESLAEANGQMQVAIAKADGSHTGIAAVTFGRYPAGKR